MVMMVLVLLHVRVYKIILRLRKVDHFVNTGIVVIVVHHVVVMVHVVMVVVDLARGRGTPLSLQRIPLITCRSTRLNLAWLSGISGFCFPTGSV